MSGYYQNPYFFTRIDRLFVHTKPVNPVTETALNSGVSPRPHESA